MCIQFRPASHQDFDYCRRLYFATMATVTPEQELSFRERWIVSEVRLIACNGLKVGWLQSRMEEGALFLVQLFVEPTCQGKGIGTETLTRLLAEAAGAHVPMTLGVVKSNPAIRLYQRLGFEVTHEDDRKFYLKHELGGVSSLQTDPESDQAERP